jgi:hypothetical protein
MAGAGIFHGDFLAVDRSLTPGHGDVVVAIVDGERSLKRLLLDGDRPRLVFENPDLPAYALPEAGDTRVVPAQHHKVSLGENNRWQCRIASHVTNAMKLGIMAASGRSLVFSCPSLDDLNINVKQVKDAAKSMVNHFSNASWLSVKGWNRWIYDRPGFGRGQHASYVASVEGSFSQEESNPASFL